MAMVKRYSDLLIHPGETIIEVMDERGVTAEDLASQSNIPLERWQAILDGQAQITEEVASSLEQIFEVPKSFWINLQKNYDEEQAFRTFLRRRR